MNEKIQENKTLFTKKAKHQIIIQKSDLKFHYNSKFKKRPRWIVVHYSGIANASAKSCAKSISRTSRDVSTHFFVDEKEIINCVPESHVAWHVASGQVEQPYKKNKKYLTLDEIIERGDSSDWRFVLAAQNHKKWIKDGDDFRGNFDGLGVDLCVKKKDAKSDSVKDLDWYFEDATIEHAAALIAYLCVKYSIDLDHVIRHGDATGKPCPRPFISLSGDFKSIESVKFCDNCWEIFKEKIAKYIEEGVETKG